MAKKKQETPEVCLTLPEKNVSSTVLPSKEIILALLDPKKELMEDRPTAGGLRRIIKEYTSFEVIGIESNVVKAADETENARATVTCKITYIDRSDEAPRPIRVVQDAADCSWRNTKAPFNRFPTATASTMAEGRCYRKMLNLDTLTAEESLEQDPQVIKEKEDEENNSKPISELQITQINKIAKSLKIDPMKILEVHEKRELPESIKGWSAKDARDTLRYLARYQKQDTAHRDYLPIPESIKII